jgi:hypothetical protein
MLDALLIGIGLGCVALTLALIVGCERLMPREARNKP